jgi:hypothetical protein
VRDDPIKWTVLSQRTSCSQNELDPAECTQRVGAETRQRSRWTEQPGAGNTKDTCLALARMTRPWSKNDDLFASAAPVEHFCLDEVPRRLTRVERE